MVNVDRLIDSAGRVHCRSGYSVVRVAPEGSGEPFRSLDNTALGVEKLYGHHGADPRPAQPNSSTDYFHRPRSQRGRIENPRWTAFRSPGPAHDRPVSTLAEKPDAAHMAHFDDEIHLAANGSAQRHHFH